MKYIGDIMEEYIKFIENVSNESAIWDERFREIIKNGTSKELIQYCKDTGVKYLYREDYLLQHLIFTYTINNSEEAFNSLKEFLLNSYGNYILEISIIHNDKFNIDELYIRTTEGDIHSIILSHFIPSIKEKFTYIDTEDRNSKCYFGSFSIAVNLGIPCKLITGYIYGNSDKAKFLHSFVETNIKGFEVVIDFTSNVIMDKESYYRIKHVNPDEIVQIITNEEIKNDLSEYGEEMNEIGLRIDVYNVFRDKIIEILKTKKSYEVKKMDNKIVIFDWSGVIMHHEPDINNDKQAIINTFKKLLNISDDEAWNIYINTIIDENGVYISAQNDDISKHKWIDRINCYCNSSISLEELENIFVEEYLKTETYKEVVEYIQSLLTRCKVGIYSDLIYLCLPALDKHVNLSSFDYVWLSFNTHHRKSEEQSFKIVENDLKIETENILLIDDTLKNIEIAKRRGWNTCLATGNELEKIKDVVESFIESKKYTR